MRRFPGAARRGISLLLCVWLAQAGVVSAQGRRLFVGYALPRKGSPEDAVAPHIASHIRRFHVDFAKRFLSVELGLAFAEQDMGDTGAFVGAYLLPSLPGQTVVHVSLVVLEATGQPPVLRFFKVQSVSGDDAEALVVAIQLATVALLLQAQHMGAFEQLSTEPPDAEVKERAPEPMLTYSATAFNLDLLTR